MNKKLCFYPGNCKNLTVPKYVLNVPKFSYGFVCYVLLVKHNLHGLSAFTVSNNMHTINVLSVGIVYHSVRLAHIAKLLSACSEFLIINIDVSNICDSWNCRYLYFENIPKRRNYSFTEDAWTRVNGNSKLPNPFAAFVRYLV